MSPSRTSSASDGRSAASEPYGPCAAESTRPLASAASATSASSAEPAVRSISTGVSVTGVSTTVRCLQWTATASEPAQRRFFLGLVVVEDRWPGGRRAGRGVPDGLPDGAPGCWPGPLPSTEPAGSGGDAGGSADDALAGLPGLAGGGGGVAWAAGGFAGRRALGLTGFWPGFGASIFGSIAALASFCTVLGCGCRCRM